MRFSANLGFLWTDRSLPEAIRAAAKAGFDAVECHWPYDTDPSLVRRALEETELPMISLNTRVGGAGEFGLAALAGREPEAREALREALHYARAVGARAVHVMAGGARGEKARHTFLDNLRHGLSLAAPHGIDLLIEPLNPHDAPGYFLRTTDEAHGILEEIGAPGLRLMFDCYHVGRTEGDVLDRFKALHPHIGHVQIASVPHRGAPDEGALDYGALLAGISALGWDQPIGVEYRPEGETGASLGWMAGFRRL